MLTFSRNAFVAGVLGGAVLAAGPANAIVINPTYTGFTADQQAVIGESVDRWEGLIGGQHQIAMNFSVDNSLSALASTSDWVQDGNGRPTSANIAVRESGYNWTTGAPAPGQIDALRGMSHELGHAIGWTVNLPNFSANVTTDSGNRYYDIDGNGSFNAASDFDLIDDTSRGTHAPDGSNDLMQPVAPVGQRFEPNIRHAAVLTDAFDYGVMLTGFGGPAGYGDLAMGRNDDDSSNQLNLPFETNLYGNSYDTFFVNNNGNLSFEAPLLQYTPDPFPIADQPMIAPYWGDVDTSCTDCGEVYVASPNDETVVVTWDKVGFYDSDPSKKNSFQVVIRDRSMETGNDGDFDFEFRYDHLEWTTGDASGGVDGLGGTPAQVGLDAGDLVNYFALPGSRTAAVLNLQNTTNLTPEIPGVWAFSVRSGTPPGSTPDNPLLPVATDDGWNFDFNIGDTSNPVWIDPIVAIGYDYIVNFGPNIQMVELPAGIGDGIYDLWLFDTLLGEFVDSGLVLTGGVAHDFGPGGVDRFRILGIEPSAGLDPTDPLAFITGLWFTGTGLANMDMNPITYNTDPGSGGGGVPAPATLPLLLAGMFGLGIAGRARRRSA